MTSVAIREIPSYPQGEDSVTATDREGNGDAYLKETSSPFLLQAGDRS
jgi:hypothetical protein